MRVMCSGQTLPLEAWPSRRVVLRVFGAGAVGLAFGSSGWAKDTKTPPKPQNLLSPDAALERLIGGNNRYVAGEAKRHDFVHERETLVEDRIPTQAS